MRDQDAGRIVLALDLSPRSRVALEMAAVLAAALDVELVGVFVEDINLLHLCGLPFTREVGLFSPGLRRFSVQEVERELNREAADVRQQLADTAARLGLRWSFQVARGQIAAELFALANEPDLVVLGKRARTGAMSLGDFFAAPGRAATQLVAASGAVLAVYDGSPTGRRALELARQIAAANGRELKVLVEAASDSEYAQREIEIKARLSGTAALYRRIASVEPRSLAAAGRQEKAGVLVLGSDGRFRGGEGFYILLNELDCPVVLVG
ncbi:MAG TPA: universal stress protein [Gallionellaceae bacterium]|nr:universal stress protein [Gallionellaceae bacterium]